MKLSNFKTDATKANEGVVKEFGTTPGECYIRVARHNNPQFESKLRKLLEPYRTYRKSKVQDDVVEECTKRAMSEFILLNMVGFEDDTGDIVGTKGAVIEDTAENRYKVLSHPDYSDFLELVSSISSDSETFRVEQQAEELGKL